MFVLKIAAKVTSILIFLLPMIKRENITGIVLAGGRGSRLGQEKGLCLFREKPLVHYALDILKPLCGTLLISANRHMDDYQQYGVPVIRDETQDIGPLGGILSCLKQSHTQHNLILSCDTPFVNAQIFSRLIDNIKNFQVVAPAHETFLIEPLSAYYATNIIGTIENQIRKGDYKIMHLLKQARFNSVSFDETLPFYSELTFLNINTPDALEKANTLF